MGAWKTDLVAKTRTWSKEGMALFGLNLPDGRGQVGGEAVIWSRTSMRWQTAKILSPRNIASSGRMGRFYGCPAGGKCWRAVPTARRNA